MSGLPAGKDLWLPFVLFAVNLDAWLVLARQDIDFQRRARPIEGEFVCPIILLGAGREHLYYNEWRLNSVRLRCFTIIPVASVAGEHCVGATRRMTRNSNILVTVHPTG